MFRIWIVFRRYAYASISKVIGKIVSFFFLGGEEKGRNIKNCTHALRKKRKRMRKRMEKEEEYNFSFSEIMTSFVMISTFFFFFLKYIQYTLNYHLSRHFTFHTNVWKPNRSNPPTKFQIIIRMIFQ